jgi:hypothetical protein
MNHSRKNTPIGFAKAILLILLVAIPVGAATAIADDDEPKKKLTIKEIMDVAHKKGLIKKVATDKASNEEKKKLHDLYTQMAKLKPPKGDQKSWESKTKALVKAAKAAVDKDATFKAKLKAASNCANCHNVHKPK